MPEGVSDARGRAAPSRLTRRPEAKILKIEDLLREVSSGRLRVPPFQRPLRWRAKNVIELFDSAYRGYPIGDLLFTQQAGPDQEISFGTRRVHAEARPDAWYIVDGQQRVTAFAGALLHPDARPSGDIHAIWFDLGAETFHWLPAGAEPGDFWVPVRALADARELHRWWSSWPQRIEHEELVERLYEVSKSIREYQIPVYVLQGAPEDAVREVFQRVNSRGTQMTEAEVFNALHAVGGQPKPLDRLRDRISETGFGLLDEKLLLRCIKAATGADPGADLSVAEVPMEPVERALRRAVGFLQHAGVPHFRLMPYLMPLSILCRFFALHERLEPRDRLLLSRWLWRGLLNGAHTRSAHAEVRRIQRVMIGERASDDVQGLLHELHQVSERDLVWGDLWSPWVGTSAQVKLAELGLIHLGALQPDGSRLDLDLFRARLEHDGPGRDFLQVDAGVGDPIVGRFLLLDGRRALGRLRACENPHVLASHGLDAEAARLWRAGAVKEMLWRRAEQLERELSRIFSSFAEWSASDRPSIRALVERANEQVHAGA